MDLHSCMSLSLFDIFIALLQRFYINARQVFFNGADLPLAVSNVVLKIICNRGLVE